MNEFVENPKEREKKQKGYCEKCKSYWECIKSHERKGCFGRPKRIVKKEICKFCMNEISKSNLERHKITCNKKSIRRRKGIRWNNK